MDNLIVGNRYRVLVGSEGTAFLNKIGRAVSFDHRCGTVYLVFSFKEQKGRHRHYQLEQLQLFGKLKTK